MQPCRTSLSARSGPPRGGNRAYLEFEINPEFGHLVARYSKDRLVIYALEVTPRTKVATDEESALYYFRAGDVAIYGLAPPPYTGKRQQFKELTEELE